MAEGIETCIKNNVRVIKFCNVRKKNAISPEGYKVITDKLNSDANNNDVKLTIFTGTDEYFTSGNDLTSAASKLEEKSFDEILEESWVTFKQMVKAFLRYPKLTIAVVNGPAIGIGVTICGLCDIAYASSAATFQTPFVKLGLSIEGCASYLLPRIMGRSKASEMLLLGEKLNADEAYNFNLVAKVIPKANFEDFISSLYKYGDIPLESLVLNKKLIIDNIKDVLCECNERECEQLFNCQHSDLFFENIMGFLNKKSKL